MRLVDADALKPKMTVDVLGGHKRIWVCGVIDDAPTIDAQPVKRGRWELCIERFMTNIYACSVCRSKLGIPSDLVPESFYCYCPRCGARMEG